MVKKIKFPLKMKNDILVRTIEELQLNFDGERLVTYFFNGKLQIWLRDRHYDKELEQIKKINISNNEVLNNLCNIFNIKFDCESINLEINRIIKEQEKLKKVRQFTDDDEIINNIDNIVMSQEELERSLNNKCNKIYLLGEDFKIPSNIENIYLKGINTPIISIDTKAVIDFNEKKVIIENCKFDKNYCKLIIVNCLKNNVLKKKYYKPSLKLDYLLSNKDRQSSKALYENVQDKLCDFNFDINIYTKDLYKEIKTSDIFNIFDIDLYGKDIKKVVKDAELENNWFKFLDRIC